MSSNGKDHGGDTAGEGHEPLLETVEDYVLPDAHLSREKWLHRKMARSSSEKLLSAGGSFLIRESNRVLTPEECANGVEAVESNAYVLSYRSQSDEFCHFKILQSCGQFFIGGKKFQSLEHLVSYYMTTEYIIPNEFLIKPVAPKLPQTVPCKRKMIAKYNYTKVPDTDELSLALGEILTVENDSGGGWYWLKSETTRESGWVHEILVCPFVACLEELKTKDYFAVADKDQCLKYLKSAAAGAYLVREGTKGSPQDQPTLTLYVRTSDNIQRFKIDVKSDLVSVNGSEDAESMDESFDSTNSRVIDVYVMGGRKFSSVDQLINRYKSEQILDNLNLTQPPSLLLESKLNHSAERRKKVTGSRGGGFTEVNEEDDEQMALKKKMCTQDASDLVGNFESVLRKGFLDKCKPGAVKKWKRSYFVLNARDQVLYCFEDNTSRKRPKDLIDMTASQVYPIDSSLSDRSFTFQLVTRLNSSDARPSILYLTAISAGERQEWMSSLMMCQGKFPFSSSVGQLLEQKSVEKLMETKSRECQNLYMEIKEVMDLASSKLYSFMPAPHNLFILIQLDDIPYAKTCTLDQIKSQCTFQKFCFKKLPSELRTVRLLLMSKSRKSRELDLGVAMLNLQHLPKNVLHCSKLPLSPVMKNISGGNPCGYNATLPSVMGTVRCEIFLKHLTVLPEEMYSKLQECLLSREGPKLLYQLGQCLPVDERNFYASLLLKTYLHLGKEIDFIVSLNWIEIEQEEEQTSLFRSTSLAASVMEHYLNIVMLPFVQQVLQPIIDDIILNPEIISCSSLPNGTISHDPERWSLLAKRYLQCLADNILGQVDKFPTNLRYVLQQIKEGVDRKWPAVSRKVNGSGDGIGVVSSESDKNQLFRYRVIASFIFLRCISLALCTPRKYHLHIGSPSHITAVQDMLKLLAKLLQSWANFTQLKEHSSFDVQSLNNYLRQNQERMEGFLEGVSTSPQGVQSSSNDLCEDSDLAEKFASVHRLCFDNHASLRKHSFSIPSLKKLLFIVEDISAKAGISLS